MPKVSINISNFFKPLKEKNFSGDKVAEELLRIVRAVHAPAKPVSNYPSVQPPQWQTTLTSTPSARP